MRRLILMRHGHAAESPDDYARTLSDVGRDAAKASAGELVEQSLSVDFVVTSSAPRARETAEIVAASLAFPGEIQSRRSLYLASKGDLLSALEALPASARSVLVVGHNPGLSSLAGQLGGSPVNLAPAQYVVLSGAGDDWRQLSI